MRKRSISFPEELLGSIEAQARQEGRSFSQQVIWLLRQPAGFQGVPKEPFRTPENPKGSKRTPENPFSPDELEKLLAYAGSEEELQYALGQLEKLPVERRKSPYGYVMSVLGNRKGQKNPKGSKGFQKNPNEPSDPAPYVRTPEELKKQARAEKIAKEIGWED